MVKVVAVVSSVLLFFLVFGFAASVEVRAHLAIYCCHHHRRRAPRAAAAAAAASASLTFTCSLQFQQFRNKLRHSRGLLIGLGCQFVLLPLTGFVSSPPCFFTA